MEKGCPCGMCINATVDEELTPENDWSYFGLGNCEPGLRLVFKTGGGKPTEILVEIRGSKHGWQTVGVYRPAYCPNCGRLLVENLKNGGRRYGNEA